MCGYIYLTTNLVNGKKYVGSHKSEIFTENYKGSGTILKKAIQKYGEENFKVILLEECHNEHELIEKEEYWIRALNAVDSNDFYNLIYSGYKRGLTGYKHSEESKNKISDSLSGELNPNYGKNLSKDNNPFYGKKHSTETKKKMSESHADFSGKNNPNYGRQGELSPLFGRHHSDETKEKIRQSNIGKQVSDETKRKISSSKKGTKLSKETREKMSKQKKESGCKPPLATGKKWITNGDKNKLVYPEELDGYLSNGYRLGKVNRN